MKAGLRNTNCLTHHLVILERSGFIRTRMNPRSRKTSATQYLLTTLSFLAIRRRAAARMRRNLLFGVSINHPKPALRQPKGLVRFARPGDDSWAPGRKIGKGMASAMPPAAKSEHAPQGHTELVLPTQAKARIEWTVSGLEKWGTFRLSPGSPVRSSRHGAPGNGRCAIPHF
jgi:hypothetical protein